MKKLLMLMTVLLAGSSCFAMEPEQDEKVSSSTSIQKIQKFHETRSERLQTDIKDAFDKISSRKEAKETFHFYGSDYYGFLGIDDNAFFDRILKESPTEQENFYVLDVGAGDFSWGKALVRYINKENLSPKIKVHIVSVTGEKYKGVDIQEIGSCKQYNIGAFNIENIEDIFSKSKEIGLKDVKFDWIVSRYTFIHLVDPAGTFSQCYDLLKPGGFISMDGFPINYHNHPKITRRNSIVEFLQDVGEPYLIRDYGSDRGFYQFLLKKTSENPSIPMQYADSVGWTEIANTAPHAVASFTKLTLPLNWDTIHSPDEYVSDYTPRFYGDQKLFDWLLKEDMRYFKGGRPWKYKKWAS